MIVAAHQPNYVPYLGYFQKMADCDIFVYLDVLEYSRGGFRARNRIKTAKGVEYLTVPVSFSKSGREKYTDVKFSDSRWKTKHLKTLKSSYSKAPYFSEVLELYELAISIEDTFVNININLIETFADYLNINSQRIKLSEILSDFGQKSQLTIDICNKLGASVYLSGSGAKVYNDEELLNRNGIKLMYVNYECPIYNQLWGEFVPNLSILDYLFSCGNSMFDGRKGFIYV